MASETNTADVINHAIDKASDGLTQIAHALSSAAPQAWALACHGVFAQGAAYIVTGFFWLLGTVVGCIFFAVSSKKANWDEGNFASVVTVFSGLLAIVFGIIAMFHLCDADSWARVISPDGYLAQSILTKALN